jgi:hypothetical protein
MTTIFVLPTADIVREYQDFDPLFVFYEDGIRGVIRDSILLSEGWSVKPTRYREVQSWRDTRTRFLEKVLRDYSNSPEAVLTRLLENTSAEMYVELVTEDIMRRVMGMMHDVFRHLVYDVSKAEWKWIGNDLATRIRIYD